MTIPPQKISQGSLHARYRARHRYEPKAKFTTWVHTIANNIASDLRQRAYRRKEWGVASSPSASGNMFGLEQMAVAASGLRQPVSSIVSNFSHCAAGHCQPE